MYFENEFVFVDDIDHKISYLGTQGYRERACVLLIMHLIYPGSTCFVLRRITSVKTKNNLLDARAWLPRRATEEVRLQKQFFCWQVCV